MGDAVFIAVVLMVALYSARAISAGRGPSVTVAIVATAIYVVCLWVPGHLQETSLISSKLFESNFALPPDQAELQRLALQWALEITVLTTVEFLVWHTKAAVSSPQVGPIRDSQHIWERAAYVLVAIGVIATLAIPSGGLDERAEGGQGALTLLRTMLVTGLTILIYFRCFGRRWGWVVVLAGVGFLIASNVRSPLLVLICAFVASEMRLGRLQRRSRVLALVALVIAFALVGSAMSGLRANLTRGYGYSTTEVLSQSLENPWVAPFESGLDTLDGYRFSERISEFEEPMPADLANVVITFVPRSLWPDKPSTISVNMSAKYLNYSASGQYLSPTGYFTLAFGSYPAALVGLAAFSLLLSMLIRRYAATFWYSILLVVAIRFLLGGSSFDIYYGITLALTIWIALALVKMRDAIRVRPLGKGSTFEISPTAPTKANRASRRRRTSDPSPPQFSRLGAETVS